MSYFGKCPKCEQQISTVLIGNLEGKTRNKETYRCATYICPSCTTLIGIQIDPILLSEQIIKKLEN